jgi:hypothetical protein
MQAQFLSDEELDRNYDAFKAALPQLMTRHAGRFVIVRNEEILDAYDTIRDAHLAGWRLFNDDRFSVQEVTDEPAYLGIYSHVLDIRTP